jgi:hypothetical protein
MHPLRIRLKNIQNQPASPLSRSSSVSPQVFSHGFETRNLLFNFKKMLHRPKRNNHQLELFPKIKPCHISLHQMHQLARFRPQNRPFLVAPLQHPLGNIQPRDPVSRLRQRQSDPPRPATQFEHWIAKFVDCIAVKRNIPHAPPHNRRLVVIIGNKPVVKRAAHGRISFASFISFTSFTSFHHRIRLNLHQHLRRNQFVYFHHARGWPYRPEKLAMCPPNLFPLRNIRHKNPRPHHILQPRSRFCQRRFDVPNRLHRLRVRISYSDDFAIWPRSRGSRYRYYVSHAHCPRIPHNRFPSCPARNILPCQMSLLCVASLCSREAAC